jgi:shikimate kinase
MERLSKYVNKRGQHRYAAKFLPGVNLYLVGFMATGKSTVGRALAYRLGYDFFDSDLEIERRRGMPVREIFEQEGEEVFRSYERDFIESGHPESRCVVACGGGLVTRPGMIELLKEKGVVVCLYATTQTVLLRTQGNRSRPLLDTEDPEARIRELMAAREPFYRRAGTLVLTDNRGLADVVEHLNRVYLREAGAFVRRKEESGAGDEGREARGEGLKS